MEQAGQRLTHRLRLSALYRGCVDDDWLLSPEQIGRSVSSALAMDVTSDDGPPTTDDRPKNDRLDLGTLAINDG